MELNEVTSSGRKDRKKKRRDEEERRWRRWQMNEAEGEAPGTSTSRQPWGRAWGGGLVSSVRPSGGQTMGVEEWKLEDEVHRKQQAREREQARQGRGFGLARKDAARPRAHHMGVADCSSGDEDGGRRMLQAVPKKFKQKILPPTVNQNRSPSSFTRTYVYS